MGTTRNRLKVAIVVQRAGKEIVGGSEAYAFQLAEILSVDYHVDILSSCSQDHVTWANHYEEGAELIHDNFNIVRFKNDYEREQDWFSLNASLMNGLDIFNYIQAPLEEKQIVRDRLDHLPSGFCEEWMRRQGPYSSSLLDYIASQESEYSLFIFMTYLYATTYFGIQQISNRNKIVIVPTFHDEPYAFLPIIKNYRDLNHFFLTNEERVLAQDAIYQEQINHEVIGFGLNPFAVESNMPSEKYFIYVGRLEGAKGVHLMYDMFAIFNKKYPDYKLYTIGKGALEKSGQKNIVYKGFVDEETKYKLISNAIALIHPSGLESLGIVLLESFMVNTPVIVNAKSKVLEEHVLRSDGGYCYNDELEFVSALSNMLDQDQRNKLALNGYNYYQAFYAMESYKQNCIEQVQALIKAV